MAMRTRKPTAGETRQQVISKADPLIEEGWSLVSSLQEELETMRDNLEEHFSATARYEAVDEAVNTLDEVVSSLETALDGIRSVNLDW